MHSMKAKEAGLYVVKLLLLFDEMIRGGCMNERANSRERIYFLGTSWKLKLWLKYFPHYQQDRAR